MWWYNRKGGAAAVVAAAEFASTSRGVTRVDGHEKKNGQSHTNGLESCLRGNNEISPK